MLQPYKVFQSVALPETVIGYLKENGDNDENDSFARDYPTIGSFLSGTNFMWYANGPRLAVVNSKSGAKLATWKFGSILKDTSTKVVCVAEIPIFYINLPLLVVGLECALTGGSICIFDIITSKVLRVIQLKDKVTSVCVINGGDGIFSTLGPLQAFDGIVAVGMAGGEVYLIDLCRQSIDDARYASSTHEIKDELNACQITVLTPEDIEEIELHKQRAAELGNHLAIHLNAFVRNNLPHFILKGPSGEDRIHANKSEVTVSALHYSSELGSVLIGYNFGAFQMWNIINMELVYTSPVFEGNIPISHFAVQEPTDDPRIFCYIWAVYSNTEPYQLGFPVAVLYALNFECKEWHDGYGYLYERFQSCGVCFQNELSLPHHTTCNGRPKGGQCLRLYAFSKGKASRNSMFESHEDTLTVCWAIWNIWCRDRCEHTLLSIFDLNQWYKEQLPAIPDPSKYKRYMSLVSLSDLVFEASRGNSPILDAHINEATINQFVGAQKLDEHYYPCTLAFDCSTCTENNIVCIASQGQQRTLLTYIETNVPLILLKPVEVFEELMTLGLTPMFTELPQDISINFQREQILNIILEQQMVGCLCKCVSTCSKGSYMSAGCSLEFFLSWAWNRASILKANVDKLCVPLFDYSGVKLDANNQGMLNNCFKQLSNLSIVYEFMCNKLSTFLPNIELVQQQWNCIHLISVYLEVLWWLLNVGLLPEYPISMHKEVELSGTLRAPYPVASLLKYYNERREYLQSLNKQKYNSDVSLLFIDNLIDLECGGEELHKNWQDDDGNGFYPPQSLQSLLHAYLIDDADLMCKHCVIFYVFLDLAMALDQERYKMVISHLIKFPAVFKLSPSIIKITQGFWQLDHGDFETAMELLLDAHIYPGDLKLWHHHIVLNALLVQEQYKFALLYLQVRRPPLTDVEDLYKTISLFVYNNLLDEAMHYQRHNSTKENELLLLRHTFEECDKNNKMEQLISYGLSQCEEEALMKYLEEVNHPNMEQFRVIYYLQQSRYMDIFEMQGDKPSKQLGLVGQRNMNLKDGMIKTLSSFFPKISRNLISVCQEERENLNVKSERPKPMSVTVHDMKGSTQYKSTLIHGILKARETWADTHVNKKLANEDTPFLRTPVVTPTRSASKIPMISHDGEVRPPKKLKLTSRKNRNLTPLPFKSFFTVSSLTHLVRLDTPIVKRKLKKQLDSADLKEKFNVCIPQSILKVRNLISQASHSGGDSPVSLQENETCPEPVSLSKALKLSPRKSLSRSTVRFKKLSNSTASSETPRKSWSASVNTSTLSGTPDEITIANINKDSSQSADDVYYSPESSGTPDNISDISKSLETPQQSTAPATEVDQNSTINLIDDVSITFADSLIELDDTLPKKKMKFPPSPKSRPSYRNQSSLSSDSIQTRSRTRLISQKDLSTPGTSKSDVALTPVKHRTSSSTPKGRKSLSRQVLENNARASRLPLSDSAFSASHTVEKHRMNVEESSPDLKKMIADFSKYVSDMTVTVRGFGNWDSKLTSFIHTEVQNSSSVQLVEASDNESVATTDMSDLNMSLQPQDLESSGKQEDVIGEFELKENLAILAEELEKDNNETSRIVITADDKQEETDGNVAEQTDTCCESENPLERNISWVEGEKEDELLDEHFSDDKAYEIGMEEDNEQENPLENNIYLVEEQEDENLNATDEKTEPTGEIEIVEIIEISDTSEESGSLHPSCDSRGNDASTTEEEEDEDDDEEEEEEEEFGSEVESKSSADEPEGHATEEEALGKEKPAENYVSEPQKVIETCISQPEESKGNIECTEAEFVEEHVTEEAIDKKSNVSQSEKGCTENTEGLPLITVVNSESQNQAIGNTDASNNLQVETSTPQSDFLNKAYIFDQSFAESPLEVTKVDSLAVSVSQETIKVAPDSSDELITAAKSETPLATRLRKRVSSCDLESSPSTSTQNPKSRKRSASVHEAPVKAAAEEDVMHEKKKESSAVSLRAKRNLRSSTSDIQRPETDIEAKPEAPVATRLRKRASSCDLESSPSTSKQNPKSRKRSASVDEAFVKAAAEEDVSHEKEKESATVLLREKRNLDGNGGTSDMKWPEDCVEVRSRNRRAASVSNCRESGDSPPSSRNRRAKSIQNLSTIQEEGGIEKLRWNKHQSPTDSLEEYLISRRLTRSQRSLMKKSKDAIEAVRGSREDLDEGKSDADEMGIENSSQSSVTDGSVSGNLRKRTHSQDSTSSVVSTVASASDMGSQKKKGRIRRLSTESVASSDRQLRSSSSTLASKASQKRNQLSAEIDPENSPDLRRSARTRSKPGTPEISSDSDSVVPRKTTRRRLVTTESDLPQIPEENNGAANKELTDKSEIKKGQKRKINKKK